MTTDDTTPDEHSPRDIFTKSFTLTVGFLGVLGLGALGFWIAPNDTGPDASQPACERPASTDVALTGPIIVDGWERHEYTQTPVTVYGPSRVEDNIPTCYEHSPAGAAVAAATMATFGDNGRINDLLDHLTADSEARDVIKSQTPDTENHDGTVTYPVAVRVNDYEGDRATVTVVLEPDTTLTSINTNYATITYDLVWDDGDWKWDAPTRTMPADVIETTHGYNALTSEEN